MENRRKPAVINRVWEGGEQTERFQYRIISYYYNASDRSALLCRKLRFDTGKWTDLCGFFI